MTARAPSQRAEALSTDGTAVQDPAGAPPWQATAQSPSTSPARFSRREGSPSPAGAACGHAGVIPRSCAVRIWSCVPGRRWG